MHLRLMPTLATLALVLTVACGGDATTRAPDTIDLASTDFEDAGPIPEEYGCDGRNVSPNLRWSGRPEGTASQAVIMDDPDAGGYVHWVVYDLLPETASLEEIGQTETLPGGGTQGKNSRGDVGYTGACPPRGETHTYVVTVYALDTVLGLEPGASRDDVEAAMEGHVLAFGELRGTFGRQ